MRQTSRGKQLRPMFDSLDLRIAPASIAMAVPAAPAAETSTASSADGTTSITTQPPKGGGGSTTNPNG